MQKYIHLVQIVETEKVAANQLRTQLEDQDTEIERLKFEVTVYAWAVPFNGLFSNVQSNFMNQWATLDPNNSAGLQKCHHYWMVLCTKSICDLSWYGVQL